MDQIQIRYWVHEFAKDGRAPHAESGRSRRVPVPIVAKAADRLYGFRDSMANALLGGLTHGLSPVRAIESCSGVTRHRPAHLRLLLAASGSLGNAQPKIRS